MSQKVKLLRETAISVAINIGLSALVFSLLVNLHGPVARSAIATDFLPQSFMVAFMSTLVPGLINRRDGARSALWVIGAALGWGAASAILAGYSACSAFDALGPAQTAPKTALLLKAAYGGLLAAIVTPSGLLLLLRTPIQKS